MKFSEVIGQEQVKQRLMQMVHDDRVPHAIMLCGPAGCGKKALALAFASYLLGEREDDSIPATPAIRNAEAMLHQWQHPDLHFSYPVIRPSGTSATHKMESADFASDWHNLLMKGPYFSFEQWLEEMKAANQQAEIGVGESDHLTRKLSLKSSLNGYKISFIWLPERMNQECSNKLLKLLEEPPQQTVFLLVSEQPELLLETIRSRTQQIDVRRIDEEDIFNALIERRGIEEDDARRIARLSGGSWMKAIQTLSANNENQQFLDMFIQLMRLSYTRKMKELKLWSDTVAGYGRERQKRMLTYFLQLIRENFIYNFHQPELNYMTAEEENFVSKFARFINEANVIEITELYTRAIRDISQNANGRIVFYDLALQMIILLSRK